MAEETKMEMGCAEERLVFLLRQPIDTQRNQCKDGNRCRDARVPHGTEEHEQGYDDGDGAFRSSAHLDPSREMHELSRMKAPLAPARQELPHNWIIRRRGGRCAVVN